MSWFGTPDIIVEDIWFSSLFGGDIATGDTITLNTTIKNIGNADANGITVNYYIDKERIGTDSIGRIGIIDRDNNESISWTVDRSGAFDVTVRVTLDEEEQSTSNNARTESYSAVAKGSDVVVEDLSLYNFSGRLREGRTVTLKTDLDNLGNDHTGLGGFNLTYYANDEEIGQERVAAGLAPGQDWSQYFAWEVDRTGPVELSARVSGVGNETDYTNNTYAESFFVEEPDVAVHDIRVIDTGGRGGQMRIHAEIANIGGSDTFNDAAFHVRYEINGQRYGTKLIDNIDAGDTVERMLEVDVGSQTVESVRVWVENVEGDAESRNNSRTEGGFHARSSDPVETIGTAAEDVLVAVQAAHAVYGDARLPDAFNGSDNEDNGRDDNYRGWFDKAGWTVLARDDLGFLMPDGAEDIRWQSGGLYEGFYGTGWFAQSLLARSADVEGDEAAPDTLMLVFRGTDDSDFWASSVGGQAWTGNGQFNYYEAQRPMIEAALAYANDDANDIAKLIVTGHSLGGSTADLFSAIDAQRLDPEVDLRVVSLASAGIDPDTLEDNYDGTYLIDDKGYLGQYDPEIVETTDGETELNAPGWYIGLSMSEDRVTYEPGGDESGMVGNSTLSENIHFASQLDAIDLPNVANIQTDNGKLLFSKSFGAEHDPGLYAAVVSDIASDALVEYFDRHQIVAGRPDLEAVKDLRGEVFALMPYADGLSNPSDMAFVGPVTGADDDKDYVLGLGGDDQLFGRGKDDLLSGGAGADILDGGAGNDVLFGGAGDDVLIGDTGSDAFALAIGMGDDTVGDFDLESDSVTYLDGAEDGARWDISVDGERMAVLSDGATLTLSGVARNYKTTGEVVVTGEARLGETLSADASGLSDRDGMGDITFVWLRDGTVIEGATGPDYQLGDADLGAAISVRAAHVDGYDSAEVVISAETDPVRDEAPEPEPEPDPRPDPMPDPDPAPEPDPTPDPERALIEGDDRSNWLAGSGEDELIRGLGGNDTLIGGGGDDVLVGGAGVDVFVLRPDASGGILQIEDWGVGGRDLLAIDDQLLGMGDLDVDIRFVTRAQAGAALRSGQVTYEGKTGAFWIDADRAQGPGDPIQIAELVGGGPLDVLDVLLF